MYVSGVGTRISTEVGAINITGVGGNNGNNNRGILIDGGAVIRSTGISATAGSITLHGTGGNNGNLNDGIYVQGNDTLVTSDSGDIEIIGYGGLGTGSEKHGVHIRQGGIVTSTGTGAWSTPIIESMCRVRIW